MNTTNPWFQIIRRAAPLLMAVWTLASVAQVGAAIPSTTTLASSDADNITTYGDVVTFTATVTGGGGLPVGTVQFKVDGANVGAPVALTGLGQASYTPTRQEMPAGTRSVTAVYHDTRSTPIYSDSTGGPISHVVNQLTMTVTATGIDRQYDATVNVAVQLHEGGVLAGDDALANYSAATLDLGPGRGDGKAVTVTLSAISGAQAANYTYGGVTTVPTTVNILLREVTLAAGGAALTKTYDGNNLLLQTNTLTLTVNNRAPGETATHFNVAFNLTANPTYNNASAGSSKPVNFVLNAPTGTQVTNYVITTVAAPGPWVPSVGVINKKSVNIALASPAVADKAYDGGSNVLTQPFAVSYWRGENNANDSQDGNHLGWTGATAYVPPGAGGAPGSSQAFNLDGTKFLSTVNVAVNVNGMNFGTADFTVVGWLKSTAADQQRTVISFGTAATALYLNANGKLQFGALAESTVAGFNDGAWHQFAIVRQAGVITYYKDQAAAGTAAFATAVVPTVVRIGSDIGAGGKMFLGQLDEIAVYARALRSFDLRFLKDNINYAYLFAIPTERVGNDDIYFRAEHSVWFMNSAGNGFVKDQGTGYRLAFYRTSTTRELTLSGAQSGNYSFTQPSEPTTMTGSILRKALVVTAAPGYTRVYNGSSAASPTVTINSGQVVSGETVTVGTITAAFTSPSAGTGKTVNITAVPLSGSGAGNYIVSTMPGPLTDGTISKRNLLPEATVAASKVYDGSALIDITGRSFAPRNDTTTSPHPSGVIPGDDVNLGTSGTATFPNENAGQTAVAISGFQIFGSSVNNYQLWVTTYNTTSLITPRPLTVSVVAGSATKVYDGTTAATPTLADDRIPGDDVTYAAAGPATFNNKNVGVNKPVSDPGVAITGGADAGNYTLASTTATGVSDITAKPITVTATGINKEYDGNTTAQVTLNTPGVYPGDITGSTYTANFDNANLGTGKTVTVSAFSFTGPGVGNYSFNLPPITTTADIIKHHVVVKADDKGKCYTQPPQADPTPTYSIVSGTLMPGDSITGAPTIPAHSENTGTYPITQGTLALNIAPANQPYYDALTFQPGTLTISEAPACTITGPSPVSQNLNVTYTAAAGMSTYTWTATGNAEIIGSRTSQSVTVKPGSGCGPFLLISTISSGGCFATCSNLINVLDITPPAFAAVNDVMVECTNTYNLPTPTVTDDCTASTNIVVTSADSPMVTVTEAVPQGWKLNTYTNAIAALVDWPTGSSIPAPAGTAFFSTEQGYAVAQMDTTNFDGALLSSLTELNYRALRVSGSHSNDIYIILTVTNGVDTVLDSLVFEPKFQNGANSSLPLQGAVLNGVWQQWSAFSGGWYSARHPEVASQGSAGSGNAGVQPLAAYLAAYPNTKLVSASNNVGGLQLLAGNYVATWELFSGHADALIVGTNGVSTGYNFEGPTGNNCTVTKQKEILIRTWTATDEQNNRRSKSQLVIVRDTMPPTFVGVPANITISCDATLPGVPENVAAVDVCWQTPIESILFTQTSTQDPSPTSPAHYNYTVTRTWSATDDCGNTGSSSQVITVRDTTAPTLANQGGPVTVSCGQPLVFTPPTVTDNCTPSQACVLLDWDTTTPGACAGNRAVTKTWVGVDVSGNISAPVTQTITVVDTTPPTLQGGGNVTSQCDAVQPASGVTVVDECDPNPVKALLSEVSTKDQYSTNIGSYNYTITRTWGLMDACGNSNYVTQVVTVLDTTPPTLSGQGGPRTTNCPVTPSSLVFDPPTVLSDNCTPTALLTLTNWDLVQSGQSPGQYTVTRFWQTRDVVGNTSAPVSQTYTVSDTTPPNFPQPADITTACGLTGTTVNYDQLTGTDSCDQTTPIFICTPPSGSTFSAPSTVVTCVARDLAGNESAARSFTVWLVDRTGPLISVADTNVACTDATTTNITGAASAVDVCGGQASVPTNLMGTFIEISPANMDGWSFLVSSNSDAGLVSGPNVTPLPGGSAELRVTNNGFASIQSGNWHGQYLSNLTEIRYYAYREARLGDEAVSLILFVDTDGNDVFDDILYFEPRYQLNGYNGTPIQNGGSIANGTWQEWSALKGAWWSQFHPTEASPGPGAKSLANYLIAHPSARIVNPASGQGGVRLQAGDITGNWVDFTGNVDAFMITLKSPAISATAYDFESVPGLCGDANDFVKSRLLRTWVSWDSAVPSNVSTHSQIILVRDEIAPTVVNSPDRSFALEGCSTAAIGSPHQPYSAAGGTMTLAQLQAAVPGSDASDSCGGVSILYQDSASGSCPVTVIRHLWALDDCGNSTAMSDVTFTINDTTAPDVRLAQAVITAEGCSTASVPSPHPAYSPSSTRIDNLDYVNAWIINNTPGCPLDTNVTGVWYSDTLGAPVCPNVVEITRTFVVRDPCGNSTPLTQTINIIDTTAPVASIITTTNYVACGVAELGTPNKSLLPYQAAPTQISVATFRAEGGQVSDACGDAGISVYYQDSAQGTCPVVVTRTYTIWDSCFNTIFFSQTINLQETVPPTVSTGSLSSMFYVSVTEAEAACFAATTASDNCTAPTNLTKRAISAQVGQTCDWIIKVVAKDACNNETPVELAATYSVKIDNAAPSVVCPAAITTNVPAGQCSVAVDPGIATATDNCDSAPTVVRIRSDGLAITAPYPVGTTTITNIATDDWTNSAVCLQSVIVHDVEPPTFVKVSDSAVSWWKADGNPNDSRDGNSATWTGTAAYAAGQFGQAFSLDGTSQSLSAGASGMAFSTGDFSVTGWLKTSDTNQQRTVFSFDSTGPALFVNAVSGKLQFGALAESTAGGFSDGAWHHFAVVRAAGVLGYYKDGVAVGSAALGTAISPAAFLIGTDGTTARLFKGQLDEIMVFNSALTQDQVKRLRDNDGCPPDITVSSDPDKCGTIVTFAAPIGIDTCPGASTAQIAGLTNGALFPVGTTVNTFRVTDASGNSADCSFSVTVLDTTPPWFTNCTQNIAVDTDANDTTCGKVVTYTVPGGTDNCPGAVTVLKSGLASGSRFPVGINTVVYEVTDAVGLTAQCTFTVTVTDRTAPLISGCPANIAASTGPGRANCTAIVTWTPPTATDNCTAPQNISRTSIWNPGDAFPVGNTLVVYVFRDAAGNPATCTFTVTVTDTTPPVFTGCPTNMVVSANASGCTAVVSWTPPTPSDNCSLTGFTASHNPGTSFNLGTTTVTYAATDSVGLTTVCTFTVTVVDNVPPSMSGCPTDIIVMTGEGTNACDTIVTWTEPTAADTCTQVTLARTAAPGDRFHVGTNLVTYTATDANNNATNCTFKVIVLDSTPPTFTVFPSNVTVAAESQVPPVEPVGNLAATDNCGTPVITYLGATTNTSPCYTLIDRTYQATDQAGNFTQQTQTITIQGPTQDTQAPTVVAGTINACYATQEAAEEAAKAATIASDNCTPAANLVKIVTSTLVGCTRTISVTARDMAGNVTPLASAAVYTTTDANAPVIGTITAQQGTVNVMNGICGTQSVVVGDVTITVQASDDCGLTGGAPSVTLTNLTGTNTAVLVNESPTGTFNYRWTVTAATTRGTWTATVLAADSCHSTARTFTLCVDNSEVTGLVQLQGFTGTGTSVNHSRLVTFVATTNHPTFGTNVLATWTVTLTNVSGDTFSYSLVGIPATANALSAKTAWNLRSKVALPLNANGQAANVNFTTTKQLRGGDYNNDNRVQNDDYVIMGTNWLTTNPVADVNGDGQVAFYDYFVLYLNWFTDGDPQ
ncbi:MAG: HYR domain-containing protein [Verrucomicrobia bacterium]|nr:HYR domain-containing protein [Verrucomicrobiota bacterium]